MEMSPILPKPGVSPSRSDQALAKAQELEAAFLAEMLSHAGLDAAEGAFGGGPGEAQFASFLRQEQARQMVSAGGIGLAEMILRTMMEGEDVKKP